MGGREVRAGWMLVVAVLMVGAPPASPQCNLVLSYSNYTCFRRPPVTPVRYLVVKGITAQEFVLLTSDRVTHQLVTRVFAIYLKEVLGYQSISCIKVKPREISSLFLQLGLVRKDRTTGYLFNGNQIWNESMIDLEVWTRPDDRFNIWVEAVKAVDVGNIAPPGRYGLYLVSKKRQAGEDPIPWQELSKQSTIQAYKLPENFSLQLHMKNRAGEYYCTQEQGCTEGIFIPEQCLHQECITILSDYFELSGFVKEEVVERGLLSRVAWLGPNLSEVLKLLVEEYRGQSVVLAATPSPLLLTPPSALSLTPFTPPSCDLYSQNLSSCSFDPQRIHKLVSSRLHSLAPSVYDAIRLMTFEGSDYVEMVTSWKKYMAAHGNEDEAVFRAACDWMTSHKSGQQSRSSWDYWSSQTKDDNKMELVITGIFPFNIKGSHTVALGANNAVDAVNKDPNVLKNYKLSLNMKNGRCLQDFVLYSFIEAVKTSGFSKMVGILGPGCSESLESLVGIAKHFKTVVISYSAEGSSFSDREKYPYFFRTIGENSQYKYVYLAVLREFRWTQVASLTEDGSKYTEYISHTESFLKNQKPPIKFVTNKKFPKNWSPDTLRHNLEELKKQNVKIVIADVKDRVARFMMCEAWKLGMTAKKGYVWFLPVWLDDQWYDVDKLRRTNGQSSDAKAAQRSNNTTGDADKSSSPPKYPDDCSTEQIKSVMDGYFTISHQFFAPNDSIMPENKTVGEWTRSLSGNSTNWSSYAGYAYDAVWTFAYALDALAKENETYFGNIHNEESTKHFVKHLWNTSFNGTSGKIEFREGPGESRPSPLNPIIVMQWVNKSLTILGSYDPSEPEPHRRFKLVRKVYWPSGEQPVDGYEPPPKCPLPWLPDLLGLDCANATIIFAIVSFISLSAIVIIAFIIIKSRYDKKVELTQKYMKHWGIDLSEPAVSSLDKWEIPRDMVVINRRLGEGAFGTVYGGEAYLTDKGWVAVAVKTLKMGSTNEEKLDFLSEAEVMKKFDHKNIIKLLGLCTKCEPIYNVMEFMLYGDLKTYLLARRHLVNDKTNEDNDEVSSKKLTSMALDVARALSYLEQMKYVHRDLASRNCLLNAQRTVKLGDFGMTRLMIDHDYYKFTRKGMLPVRWMAPESLALGIFSPASDIWSYGVLLYEIITFGSFPFQGMTNNQVLEHVKQGNSLTIPENVNPKLETLMKYCWRQEAPERPRASEIVELISSNPRLVTACLDAPLKSVTMDDSGHAELSLENKLVGARRRSLGLGAALRRASAGSLVGSLGLPDGPNDGSVVPLLPVNRYSDEPDYCNHVDHGADSPL